MSFALALLASVLWGGADFGGARLTQRLPVELVVVASQAAALLAALVSVAVWGGWSLDPGVVVPAALAGVVGPIALVVFYTALAEGPMGVVAPVAATGVAVPVLAGIAGGDVPSAYQVAGIVVAALGAALAGRTGSARVYRARPVLLALTAALGFGIVLTLIAAASATSVPMMLVVQRAVNVVAVGGLITARPGRRPAARLHAADIPAIVAVGWGDLAANAAYGAAAAAGSLSLVAVLASLYPLVTALLARSLHGERLSAVQVAGAGAALAGVVMIVA